MIKQYISSNDYSNLKRPEGFDFGMTSYGTWGRSAAGLLISSQETNEVLLFRRSSDVSSAHTWGIPGGARKETASGLENALVAAISESKEEIGNLPRGRIKTVSYDCTRYGTEFIYSTFVLEIEPSERIRFIPNLNWEHDDYGWANIDSINKYFLHPGVKEVLYKIKK